MAKRNKTLRPDDAGPRAFDLDALADRLADFYVGDLGGLSFDFASGSGQTYRVAVAGERADRYLGGAARDNAWGLAGDDRMAGGREDDILYGGGGNDLLQGGADQDRLEGGAGRDSLYGGAQDDDLTGGDGDDLLDEGAGHGDLEGGRGNDTLVGGGGPDAFAVDRASGDDVVLDFTAGPGVFDHIVLRDGLRFEDLAFADTAGGVRIAWGGGSVLLRGVAKADLAQDDLMFTDEPDLPPGARAPDGPADERATPSTDGPAVGGGPTLGPVQASFDVAADLLLALAGGFGFDFEEAAVRVGRTGRDDARGTEGVDHLFGRGGDDRLVGLGGADVLQGDGGRDTLVGGDGADWLDGGRGDDRLSGGAMADLMLGEDGDDAIDGGAGHDMIEGGRGRDRLLGGAGADAFIVDATSGDDVVLDFRATGDAQGAFDHVALRGIRPDEVEVADTRAGAHVSWETAEGDGSVLLRGVAAADLRQSDFMFFDAPGFVGGVSAVGSYYIFPGADAIA